MAFTGQGIYLPVLVETLTQVANEVNRTKSLDRNIATAAWQLLALCCSGSSMRSGGHKDQIKTLVVWLRDHLVAANAVPVEDTDVSRTDQTVATLAILRSYLDSQYRLLTKVIDRNLQIVLDRYQQQGAAPPTTEEAILLAIMTDWLEQTEWLQERAGTLALAQLGAAATAAGKSRLHDAATHLVQLQQGVAHPIELTNAICWPGNLMAEPLHAFVGAFTMRAQSESIRASHWPRIEPLLSKRQANHYWPKTDNYDEATTTAMLLAVMGMSHPDGAKDSRAKARRSGDSPQHAWR